MLDKPADALSTDSGAAEFRNSVYASFRSGAERMRRIEVGLHEVNVAATAASTAAAAASKAATVAAAAAEAARAENSHQMQEMYASTAEMLKVFQAMKGGFKVLEWLGRLAKWFAALVAGAAALSKLMGWEWPFK